MDLHFYSITQTKTGDVFHNFLLITSGASMEEVHSTICHHECDLVLGEELVVTCQLWSVK